MQALCQNGNFIIFVDLLSRVSIIYANGLD
jgi:hypothetical protein